MPEDSASTRPAETHRLAAIMFTDIVGFSRQMGADEARMLRLLDIHNQIIQKAIGEHHGTVIKTVGDAFLVDFPSVVHAVQDEIVQQLVTTLQVEVQEAEEGRVRRVPTTNLTAYDSLLRAGEYFNRVTKEGAAQARHLFEQTIALDPQYAKAYAFLGWSYWEESRWSPAPQHLEQSVALAQKALALADSLPAAHSLLSLVSERRKQSEQATAEGERAVALDPNNAYSAAWLAEVLNYEGRPAEAIGWLEKAIRLDPRYPCRFAAQ